MRIGQDLDFDVPRAFNQFFQIDISIAKSRFGLASRGLEQGWHFLQSFRPPACLFRLRLLWL